MRYFPENTTSSFITELSNAVHLHGQWEVALSEIQFPCNFLHIGFNENVIKFLEIENEEEYVPSLTPTQVVIPKGIYKNIEELIFALNSACKTVSAHFYFELRDGGKIRISLNCGASCKLIHYINFSDKLQQILGCVIDSIDNAQLLGTLKLPDSEQRLYTETFFRLGFINEQKSRRVVLYGTEPYSLTRGIPDKMFVYCDVCESYITGDVQSPLLRIVPIEIHNFEYGANLVKYFSPPHYIPLRRTNFRQIEIDIRDNLGKRIPFESGTLTVTLHFKRVQ
jgi:hypothetical protein